MHIRNILTEPSRIFECDEEIEEQLTRVIKWIKGNPSPFLPKSLYEPLKVPDLSHDSLIGHLPSEIAQKIFFEFNNGGLQNFVLANKKLFAISKTDYFLREMFINKFAFGPKDWNEVFGQHTVSKEEEDKALKLLPSNIYEIFKNKCPIFENSLLRDSHVLIYIPENICNKPLNISRFVKLIRAKFFHLDCDLHDYLLMKTIDSGWIVITKEVLPNSRRVDYVKQEVMVKRLEETHLISYRIPKILEILIANHVYYFKTGKTLFNERKWSYNSLGANSQSIFSSLYPFGIDHLMESPYRENEGVLALFRV